MLKRTIIALAIGVLSSAALTGNAVAGYGGSSGYEPLYWNGPAGSSDYNILFRAGSRYSKTRSRSHYGISSRRSCSRLLRSYRRSGSSYALRRYHRCRAR
ncbi:MAG: hypothetical protein L3J67_12185 [Hyphomicrobiaceae bacterium]|nr:hypothetical protein [Hyphomicrobiaceae bacterium]